jgi:hypothetical protein
VQQVLELCKKLGWPAPSYKITSDGQQMFSGHAEFNGCTPGNRELPPDFAKVSSVYGGKNYVKEAIAQRVLEYLRKLDAERDAIFEELVKDLRPSIDG